MPFGWFGQGLAASPQHLSVMAPHTACPGYSPALRDASLDPDDGQHPCNRGERAGRFFPGAAAVIEFMRAVNASADPHRIAEVVVSRVARWLPGASPVVLEPSTSGQATILARRGPSRCDEATIRALGTWVLRHSRSWMSAGPGRDSVIPQEVAARALALTCRGRTVAALVVLDERASARLPGLTGELRGGLSVVLESAAVALDNARRIRRAERLARIDDLTGLCNARELTDTLRREVVRASRTGQPLSLVVIDLDGFKRINDRHGHPCGSRALIEVAGLIRDGLRRTDCAARVGGDEFAVVLPDTGRDGAVLAGNRLRARIARHVFLQRDGLDVRLTASVGTLTASSGTALAAGALLERADNALYRAKTGGGNRIECDGPILRPGNERRDSTFGAFVLVERSGH